MIIAKLLEKTNLESGELVGIVSVLAKVLWKISSRPPTFKTGNPTTNLNYHRPEGLTASSFTRGCASHFRHSEKWDRPVCLNRVGITCRRNVMQMMDWP